MSDLGAPLTKMEQLIGQSALAARLRAALEQDRIAHAVIIAGPTGSGKRSLAAILARALLCGGTGPRPCDACPQCRRALGGSHADLHTVKPAEQGKALGVDDARGLLRLIDVKPYEGGRAVVVVEDAHSMTPQAQNALLKTLEEPPAHVVLILLAETLSPLLPTILSRCAVYKMARLSAPEMQAAVRRRGHVADGRLEHAVAMADGRPGRALELLGDEGYWPLRERAYAALEQLTRDKRLAGAMKFLQDSRSRIGDVLAIWECALRDAAVVQSGSSAALLSGKEPDFLLRVGSDSLERMLSACAAAKRSLDGNAIHAVAMDNLLIEITGGIECRI